MDVIGMTKQESVPTAGCSETADLTHEVTSDLRFCGNGSGCCPQVSGEVPLSPRSMAEREERAGRLQERAAWLALAAASLPFIMPFFVPPQPAEEKVQFNVSVVVVVNHVVVNPGYSVSVRKEEGIAK